MKILESGEPCDVRNAIRAGLSLSFQALNDCFPNLNAPRNALSQYLWVPHDTAIGETYTLNQLLKQFDMREPLDFNMAQRLRHLKKSVQQLDHTHRQVLEVKRKVLLADHRKLANFKAILRFLIPKQLENVDHESIQDAIGINALTPDSAVIFDEMEEQQRQERH